MASSEELADERVKFGDFIRKLDDTYESRGFRIKLIKWEDLPIGYDGRPKQDEYNKAVRACDLFVALFRTKAGQYTLEEFEVAKKAQMEGSRPTLYIFCRELKADEHEEPELTRFKANLFNDLRHYWSKYDSSDSLQLKFVLELLRVENRHMEELKVEDGKVVLNGLPVASMDNLRFAAGNPEYQKQQQRLAELPGEIEKMRKKLERHPDDEDYLDDLQKLLNERNKLQEDFQQHQQFLFDTAKRIAQLQGEQITERMQRAMDAFESGDAHGANIILDEAQRDAQRHLSDYRQSREVTEEKRQNVIKSIEELLLNTSTTMADTAIGIEDRIAKVWDLYRQADEMAKEAEYDKEKHARLLTNYAIFLCDHGHYKESEEILLRQIAMVEELYGKENLEIATSYNNIGGVYDKLGAYAKALECFSTSLSIEEKLLGIENSRNVGSYNNIGMEYCYLGNYPKALGYFFKALKLIENEQNNHVLVNVYTNIGTTYSMLGNLPEALVYLIKAMEVVERVRGKEHADTANCYAQIGLLYGEMAEYSKALECHFKSLEIRQKVLGNEHPDTAVSLVNIGLAYYYGGIDVSKALEFSLKGLEILKKTLGTEHSYTASAFNNVALVYESQGDYAKAQEYHLEALNVWMKIFGENHPNVAVSYDNIGVICCYLDNNDQALQYFGKSLEIREKLFGSMHPDTARSYYHMGLVYTRCGNIPKAQELYFKALEIMENLLGKDHTDTARVCKDIGTLYAKQGDYATALEYLERAYSIFTVRLGEDHHSTIRCKKMIDSVKSAMEEEESESPL